MNWDAIGAIGEVIDTLPSRTSASISPTILYFAFSSVSSSMTVTVAPNFTVLPDSFDTSMISARDSWSSSSAMRPSCSPCASLSAIPS